MWLKQLTKTNFGHQIEQIKKVPLISWTFFHQSGEAKIKCFRELLQVLRWLERTLALNKVKNNPLSSSYSIGSQLRFIYIYVPLINSFWIHREFSDRLLGFVYLHGDDSFLNCPTRLKKIQQQPNTLFCQSTLSHSNHLHKGTESLGEKEQKLNQATTDKCCSPVEISTCKVKSQKNSEVKVEDKILLSHQKFCAALKVCQETYVLH